MSVAALECQENCDNRLTACQSACYDPGFDSYVTDVCLNDCNLEWEDCSDEAYWCGESEEVYCFTCMVYDTPYCALPSERNCEFYHVNFTWGCWTYVCQ